jgi:hypothetical protein
MLIRTYNYDLKQRLNKVAQSAKSYAKTECHTTHQTLD